MLLHLLHWKSKKRRAVFVRANPKESLLSSVCIGLVDPQRTIALIKIIQGLIVIAKAHPFSYNVIHIISLSLLQQLRQVQRSISLCQSADLGAGASSHVASRTVRDARCSLQIKRCCSITGVISFGDPPIWPSIATQSLLLCADKDCLPLIPPSKTYCCPPK